MIVSQAQKYDAYENNPDVAIINIDDFSKEAEFINNIYEQIREETLFSKYNCSTLEKYRNRIKENFEHPISNVLTYNVDQLTNLNHITLVLYDEYEKENIRKRTEMRNIVVKDMIIRIVTIGATLTSLILIA